MMVSVEARATRKEGNTMKTTITHNGKTATINANVGDVITKAQAKRLEKLFGSREFSDGHEIYRSVHGADNCWILRRMGPNE